VNCILWFALLSLPAHGAGSYVQRSGEVRPYIPDFKDNERYDPWMGFRIDVSKEPGQKTDVELIAYTIQQMGKHSDICYRWSAQFIQRELTLSSSRLRIKFDTLKDSPLHPLEAAYDHFNNVIIINEAKPYLRHPDNLGMKLVHESSHRVQYILDLIRSDQDFHDYAHRAKIAQYLKDHFGKDDRDECKFPDVPVELRNKVEDSLGNPRRVPGIPIGPRDPKALEDFTKKVLEGKPPKE